MPKSPNRDKQRIRQGFSPRSVADLISARLPTLVEGAPATAEGSEWHVAVMHALGPELANKVNRCTLEAGKITVVAGSSAWAARMRFALAEAEPRLRELVPDLKELVVRIRPASPSKKR
jgi:Dna[CI] antecedent DciA-like protein